VSYQVRFEKAAERDLAALARAMQRRVIERIEPLADDPRGPGTKALKASLRGLRCLRAGDWRISYQVDDEARTVTVVQIAHRRDIYQRLARRWGR